MRRRVSRLYKSADNNATISPTLAAYFFLLRLMPKIPIPCPLPCTQRANSKSTNQRGRGKQLNYQHIRLDYFVQGTITYTIYTTSYRTV